MLKVDQHFVLSLVDNMREKLAKEGLAQIDIRVLKTWLLFVSDYVEEREAELQNEH